MINATSDAVCVQCSTATVTVRDAVPWCPQCEWNLDCFEPERRRPEFGWRWLDRWTHRVAFRLTRRQYVDLSLRTLDLPRMSLARFLVVTASVLLLAGVAALAALGVWLVLYDFPKLTIVLGVAVLALAVALRPRFGRLNPAARVLSRGDAPALFGLVDDVAAAIRAPAPNVIAVDDSFNAYATAVGVRRRRVLCLGLPFWAALPPQERVAVLGHELGHFVNGDVRRGMLTQPAFTMLGSAADLIRPVETLRSGIIDMLVGVIQAMASRVLFGMQLLLVWIGQRDAQRAEYLADELAATAAGSAAAAGTMDALLTIEVIDMVVRREARVGNGPAAWRTAVAEARAAGTAKVPLLRQLSIRDQASLFSSHPPSGLRGRMLTDRAWREPAVTLTESRAEQIDAELAKHYERAQRHLRIS